MHVWHKQDDGGLPDIKKLKKIIRGHIARE